MSAVQSETAALLGRVLGQTFADRYTDFCVLASGTLPLRVSRPMAAHALREFESSLRDALTPHGKTEATVASVDDAAKLEQAAIVLGEIGFDTTAVERACEALPPRITHKTQIAAILDWLGYKEADPVRAAWGRLTKVMKTVHERSFHELLLVDEEFRRRFQEPFETVVHAVAAGLQRRYSALTRRVEEIAATPDRDAAVKAFIKEIPGALPLQWHFFNRIDTADWLSSLARLGLLKPPFPHTVAPFPFGPWAAGNYLQKIAGSTDPLTRNYVHLALQDAAASGRDDLRQPMLAIMCALPPSEAAAYSEQVIRWMATAGTGTPIELVERLVQRLAEGRQPEEVRGIGQALLRIESLNGELVTRYSRGMYEHRLEAHVRTITTACGLGGLELFVALLVQAAAAAGKLPESGRDTTVFTMWPIADDQNAMFDLYAAVVHAVRASAEQLLAADDRLVRTVVETLLQTGLDIFRRIALYVLAIHPSGASDIATALLLDLRLLEDREFSHEYAALALAWYPFLADAVQSQIITAARSLADRHLEGWKAWRHESGAPTGDEDITMFKSTTFCDAVWKWRAVLSASLQKELETSQALYGEPGVWHRNVANDEDLDRTFDFANLANEEIIAHLTSSATADQGDRQHDRLEQRFLIQVTQNAVRFASAADDFADLHPRFLVKLLLGLENAVKNNAVIPWQPVLTLIQKVVSDFSDRNRQLGVPIGMDLSDVCHRTVELLLSGLILDHTGIAVADAERLDELIIQMLAEMPYLRQREDEKTAPREVLAVARASIWGGCVELSILRVRWKALRQLAADGRSNEQDGAWLDTVLSVIAHRRQACGADTLTAAMFGSYFGMLHHFATEWTQGNFKFFFDPADLHARHAAWSGYLHQVSFPVVAVFPRLREMYEMELAIMANQHAPNDEMRLRLRRLGEHVLLLYIEDAISLSDSLMQGVWSITSPAIRREMMWTLDRHLRSTKENFSPDRRKRALAYWEMRLRIASADGVRTEEFQDEIGVFGRWSDNLQLDTLWVCDQLDAMLGAGYEPALAVTVVERLVDVSASDIDGAIKVLVALIEIETIENDILFQREAIRKVFDAALRSESTFAIEQANRLISVLATKGEMNYLDLLTG